jgi:hypothetical protein
VPLITTIIITITIIIMITIIIIIMEEAVHQKTGVK